MPIETTILLRFYLHVIELELKLLELGVNDVVAQVFAEIRLLLQSPLVTRGVAG
jgi:hypothetical protein